MRKIGIFLIVCVFLLLNIGLAFYFDKKLKPKVITKEVEKEVLFLDGISCSFYFRGFLE